jgi:urocanate hydratase
MFYIAWTSLGTQTVLGGGYDTLAEAEQEVERLNRIEKYLHKGRTYYTIVGKRVG